MFTVDVVATLGFLFASLNSKLKRVVVTARQEQTKLQAMIDKALKGDQLGLEYLHVSDMKSVCQWKKATVMTWEKLCSDYKYMGAAYNAALQMNMEYLTRVTKMNLMYLTYIAKTVFQREFDRDTVTIEAHEILEHMKLQAGEVPPARLASYYNQLTDEEDEEDERANTNKQHSVEHSPAECEVSCTTEVVMTEEDEEDDKEEGEQKKKGKGKTTKKKESVASTSTHEEEEEDDEEDDENAREKEKDEEDDEEEQEREVEKRTKAKQSGKAKRNVGSHTHRKHKDTKKKHYTLRKCPLCEKSIVHLKRHLRDVHVQRGEVAANRVDALFQMTLHGNTTKCGAVKKVNKEGSVKVYKRNKEICPLCDTVTAYLTTHLQRQHELKKNSDRYTLAIERARRYRGKTAELLWEQEQINKRKKRKSDGDGHSTPKKPRRKTGWP